MVESSKFLLTLSYLLLFHATLLGPCDRVRDARKISELDLRRSDQTDVHLVLWATPSDHPMYYVEFNGRKYKFAGGQLESTCAYVVQSPDKDCAVVLEAFCGAPHGVIELDLRTGETRNVGSRPSFQWGKDFERDGWTMHGWPSPLDPRTGQPRDVRARPTTATNR